LAQEGCDEVQGYFTGKPHPIEAYADLVGIVLAKPRQKAVAG
jgi:EAL domain-containing protein (putative c-di-GMP-specific phosphodiesterase class I)